MLISLCQCDLQGGSRCLLSPICGDMHANDEQPQTSCLDNELGPGVLPLSNRRGRQQNVGDYLEREINH